MKRHLGFFVKIILGIILITPIAINYPSFAAIKDQSSQGNVNNTRKNISHREPEILSGESNFVWTEELMKKAIPYPLDQSGESLPSIPYNYEPVGEAEIIPGSLPAHQENNVQNPSEPDIASSASSIGYEYPPPFTRYTNFDSTQTVPIPNNNYDYYPYPYSTVGVLFFIRDNVPYRCSAASIGNYAIWTAGHCIHEGDGQLDIEGNVLYEGTWSTNVRFVPGYQEEDAPVYDYGVWDAVELWITPEWFDHRDLRYDMGGALLQTLNNQKISDVVGYLGFAYNLDNAQHWTNIGYPSISPFDGSKQQICSASFAYVDSSLDDPSSNFDPVPVAMGCDMTGGSSGGPWIINLSGSQGQNLLNGSNSYRNGYRPKELFSPYFGSEAKSLYDDLYFGSIFN